MQSTNPPLGASIMFFLISASAFMEVPMEPLAKTKPATPLGDSLLIMCSIQA
jgi:hypothetical protein